MSGPLGLANGRRSQTRPRVTTVQREGVAKTNRVRVEGAVGGGEVRSRSSGYAQTG